MHPSKPHPLTERRSLFREAKPRSNPYRILIWMGLMFGAVVALATGIVLWNILHPILNR